MIEAKARADMADIRIPQTKAEFRDLMVEIVATLVALVEEKDPFLKKHCERVANNCANFCEEFQIFSDDDLETIYFAGMLHDIGIVAVPIDILSKHDSLTDEEMIRIKKHPVIGEKVLSNLGCLKDILPMVRHHHEKMDGSGYPDGLGNDEIPLGARIVGLFNYFDNLAFARSAEKSLRIEAALEKIKAETGTAFGEALIGNFVTFIESNAGKSEDFSRKRETASMKAIFTELLQKFKAGKINPPVMPQVVREVQTVIKQATSTPEELASVIEKDPVISLRLISVANSPVYRGIADIRNVKNAIPRLGLKETLNIIIAIANKSHYETDSVRYKILMDKLWVHSLAVAYGAKLIAQHLKLDDSEKFFLMGLTHDIGKTLLLKAFTEVSKGKTLSIDTITANIQEAHVGLGSALLKRWGFGDEFLAVIGHHEDTEFSPGTQKEILVVHLANMVTRQIGFSLFEGEIDFAEVPSARLLNLDPEAVEAIGKEIKQVIQDVAHLF